MKKTLIITGGDINEQFLVKEVKQNYETIIAVDKGLETALKLNIQIDHIIGDFDSLGTGFVSSLGTGLNLQKGTDFIVTNHETIDIPKIHKLNPEKDYTDTHMALKLAIELGSTDISIIGWSGTRMDHVLRKYSNNERSIRAKCKMQINKRNKRNSSYK